jgi:hypothetical protein
MVHLRIDTTTIPQNRHPHPLVNGLSCLSAIAVHLPRHVTKPWAVAIEALVLIALPHRNLNTAGQAVAHHIVLWLPPHLLITPLMAVAGHLMMAVVDTILVWHVRVAKVKVVVGGGDVQQIIPGMSGSVEMDGGRAADNDNGSRRLDQEQ